MTAARDRRNRPAMRRTTREDVLDCDVETFWKVFLDREYTEKCYLQGLDFKELEILEQTETTRRIRAVPRLEVPAAVAKLLGDRFGYEERGTLDRAKNEWRWSNTPNTLGDKLKTEGTLRVEPAGEGKCRRIDEVTFDAKVFGVGGLLETTAEKQVRAAWEKETAFLRGWLKKLPKEAT